MLSTWITECTSSGSTSYRFAVASTSSGTPTTSESGFGRSSEEVCISGDCAGGAITITLRTSRPFASALTTLRTRGGAAVAMAAAAAPANIAVRPAYRRTDLCFKQKRMPLFSPDYTRISCIRALTTLTEWYYSLMTAPWDAAAFVPGSGRSSRMGDFGRVDFRDCSFNVNTPEDWAELTQQEA